MKKLFKKSTALFLAIVMLSSLVVTGVFAETSTDGEWEYISYTTNDEYDEDFTDYTALITGYNGTDTAIEIPSSIDGYTVTDIGYKAFEDSSLESVTIPEGIETIGSYAFEWCSSLESVTIPGSVKTISDHAFYYCSSLESVTILEGVETIGAYAFVWCTSLESITIPVSVTSIGSDVFSYISSSFIINYNGTIEEWNSIDGIDDSSIDCTIICSDGCIAVDEYSWVTVGNAKIYYNFNTGDINHIKLSEETETYEIPSYVYGYEVKSISATRFSSLFTSYLPASITVASDNQYYTVDEQGILYDYAMETLIFAPTSISGDVVIPSTVTSISSYAFYGCTLLESVTIPGSVDEIDSCTFAYCTALETVTFPDSLTNIGIRAFDGCSSLDNITLPDSLESIGSYAFYNCDGLISIVIPEDVTVATAAFAYCDNLKSVTLESGVTLEDIESYNAYAGEVGGYTGEPGVFTHCENLSTVIIKEGVTTIGGFAFAHCFSITSIELPDSLISIGNGAFFETSLTTVTIPENVSDLSSSAFGNDDWGYDLLSNFKQTICEFIVDEDNQYYSSVDGILYNKDQTEIVAVPMAISGNITILGGIVNIPNQAFYYCENITSVTIEDGIETIDTYSFVYCYSLKTVTIADTVTSIGFRAFATTGLEIIYIPSSVTYMPYTVFESSPLTDIYYAGTEEEWIALTNFYDEDYGFDCVTSDFYDIDTVTVHYNYVAEDDTTTDDTTVETTVTTNNTASTEVTLDKETALSVFTAEDIAKGEELKVELSVSEVTEFTADEQTAIDELEETYEIAYILDIDLTKYVGNTATSLTDLDEEITITIDIPEELQGKDLVVIRIHDGVAETLKDIDDSDETYTFKTDKFSTYALAEVTETEEDDEVVDDTATDDTTSDDETEEDEETALDVPQTGDTSTNVIVTISMIIALIGIAYISRKKLVK